MVAVSMETPFLLAFASPPWNKNKLAVNHPEIYTFTNLKFPRDFRIPEAVSLPKLYRLLERQEGDTAATAIQLRCCLLASGGVAKATPY